MVKQFRRLRAPQVQTSRKVRVTQMVVFAAPNTKNNTWPRRDPCRPLDRLASLPVLDVGVKTVGAQYDADGRRYHDVKSKPFHEVVSREEKVHANGPDS